MPTFLAPLFVLFALIGLGWLAAAARIFRAEDSRILSNFVYFLGFPALFFHALTTTNLAPLAERNFLIVNALVVTLGFAVAYAVAAWLGCSPTRRTIVAMMVVLGNTAYLGMPLGGELFGATGLTTAAAISAGHIFFIMLVTLYLLHHQTSTTPPSFGFLLAQNLKTPLIVAIVLAAVFVSFELALPTALDKIVTLVGQTTIPLALIALGVFLHGVSWRGAWGVPLGVAIATIVALPAVAWGLLAWLPVSQPAAAITVLQAAAPLATLNFTLAQKFRVEEELVAKTILASTLAAIVGYTFWITALA